MQINRRTLLGGLGASLTAPYVLQPDSAQAAPAITVTKRIAIAGTQTDDTVLPAGAHLPNSRVVTAWIHKPDFLTSLPYVRYFRSNGIPLTAPIAMGGVTGPTEGANADSIVPVALPNGRSVILFSAKSTDATGVDFTDIFAQVMTADFKKIGTPIRINQTTEGQQVSVEAVRLTNGNILVLWRTQGTTNNSVDLKGRVISPNGVPLFPEKRVTAPFLGAQILSCLTAINNARAIFTYYTLSAATDWKVYAQTLDSTGNRVGTPMLVKSAPSVQRPFGSAGVFYSSKTGPIFTWYEQAPGRAEIEYARVVWKVAGKLHRAGFVKPINPTTVDFPLFAVSTGGNFVILQTSENVSTQKATLYGAVVSQQDALKKGPTALVSPLSPSQLTKSRITRSDVILDALFLFVTGLQTGSGTQALGIVLEDL